MSTENYHMMIPIEGSDPDHVRSMVRLTDPCSVCGQPLQKYPLFWCVLPESSKDYFVHLGCVANLVNRDFAILN